MRRTSAGALPFAPPSAAPWSAASTAGVLSADDNSPDPADDDADRAGEAGQGVDAGEHGTGASGASDGNARSGPPSRMISSISRTARARCG